MAHGSRSSPPDEDVVAAVSAALVKQGHEAWTVQEAGLSSASDEELAAYAHSTGNAVLVSHDKAFSRWRRERLIGRHLHLRCEEMDAADLLEQGLSDLLPVFEHRENAHCILSHSGFEFTFPQWK